MNKNYKIVTINGIRGIIAVVFLAFGIISGFIISPGWVCMKLWNCFVTESASVSNMNIFQGILLWFVIALSLYAINNKRALIGFNSVNGLSKEEIRDIMQRAREADLKVLKNLDLKPKDSENSTNNILENEISATEEKEEVRR